MKKEISLRKPPLAKGAKKVKGPSPNQAWDWIEDESCLILHRKDKGMALAVVTKDLPDLPIEGETQVWVSWEFSPEEKAWAIKKVFPDYRSDPVIINPETDPLEPLGVIKTIVEAVLNQAGFKGDPNEPPRKTDRKHQASLTGSGLRPGRLLPDNHSCE